MNENNNQINQIDNSQPNLTEKPVKKRLSPQEIKKRKRKRKIKIAAFFLSVILAVVLLIWGIAALISSFFDEDENSSFEDYSHYENYSEKDVFNDLFGISSEEESSLDESSKPAEESNPEENSEESNPNDSPEDLWHLLLINGKNPLPDDYQFPLKEMENELTSDGIAVKVDERIIPYLAQMLEDARNQGLTPIITSAYRTKEHQQRIMDDYISDYLSWGYSQEEAEAEAKKWVAIPGTSEHHSGLAVDISSVDSSVQDPYYIWSWLEDNAHKYGFILRYTEENQEITGVNPEPWHFRFVGLEDAKAIYESEITLEEYLENKSQMQ